MRNAYTISIFCALLFMLVPGSTLAQVFTPEECALTLDPVTCCDQPTDEASRVETARSVVKVCATPDPEQPDGKCVDHYHKIINKWAVHGSGEDNIGEDGAVYRLLGRDRVGATLEGLPRRLGDLLAHLGGELPLDGEHRHGRREGRLGREEQ